MNEATFIIPSYQRDYDWSTENVEDLLYDLTVSRKLNEYPLFLGNFTFMLNGRDSQENWEVVDGQQRLTTITLLAIALRAELNKKQAANYDTTLVETQTDLNSFLTYKDEEYVVAGPRFRLGSQYEKCLRQYALMPNLMAQLTHNQITQRRMTSKRLQGISIIFSRNLMNLIPSAFKRL